MNKTYQNAGDQLLALKEKVKKEAQEKEQQEKEKVKLTPIQQMLPDIFDEKRAIPNSFLRSALFGMIKPGKRAIVKDLKIFSMSQYDIMFWGEMLDQNDLELWDTLIYLAKERKLEHELRISFYELFQHLKITNTKANKEIVFTRLKRLKFAMLNIKHGKKEYLGNLIDNVFIDENGEGKLVIIYNKTLVPLFIDKDYTFISTTIRDLLGENQLAKWIYNFYATHKEPTPYSIEFLKELCRSEAELKEFKRMLKNSLELIEQAYLQINTKETFSWEITENNYLIIGKNKKSLTKNVKN